MALPLLRHGASAAPDLAASHTGLGIPALAIEGVRAHASAISPGALAVFRACRRPPSPTDRSRRRPLQDAQPDHLPVQNMADIHIPVFWPRGRLPGGAWLSGLTRARAGPLSREMPSSNPRKKVTFFSASPDGMDWPGLEQIAELMSPHDGGGAADSRRELLGYDPRVRARPALAYAGSGMGALLGGRWPQRPPCRTDLAT